MVILKEEKKKKRLNTQPPNLAVVLLDIYPREMKTCSHKNLYTNVYKSLIHNNPKLETQVSFNR